VAFDVQTDSINTDPALSTDEPHWGLWERDVVELFVSPQQGCPYYEFQVSPLNQYFELELLEPRVRYDRSYRSGIQHSAKVHAPGRWEAEMLIPLAAIGADADTTLIGNAYTILGERPRTFWSLYLPPQERPDFHLPQHFRPLPL
jgi:hypothetical protein